MKKIIIFFFLFFVTHLAFSQENIWVAVKVPTDEALKTAVIDKNGDIFVFGDKSYGAVSSDNGLTWNEVNNFSYLGMDIISCLIDEEKIFVASKDKVAWILKKDLNNNESGAVDYVPAVDCIPGDLGQVEKIQKGEGVVKVFPNNTGLGYNLEPYVIETPDHLSHSDLYPYNFYLPLNSFNAKYKIENYWKTRMGNKGRMVSVIANYQNIWNKIFLSDDDGRSWQEIKTGVDNEHLTFFLDMSFSGNHVYMVFAHYGGNSFFLYESKNNAEDWSFVGQYVNGDHNDSIYEHSSFKAIFNDHGIPVSVGNLRNDYYSPIVGYIQHGEEFAIVRTPLQYITGSEEKLVAVGDSGWVHIYKKGPITGQIKKSNVSPYKVYPNPSKENFYFQSQEKGTMKIISTLGQVVLVKKFEPGTTEIETAGIKSGFYVLTTSVGNNKKICIL